MDKDEVICISSDDEEEIPRQKDDKKTTTACPNANSSITHRKKDNLTSESKEVTYSNLKRKVEETLGDPRNKDETGSKKPKLVQIKNEADSDELKTNDTVNNKQEQNKKIIKPQLVVKEKRSIYQDEQDVFPMFISLCLQKRRTQSMKTIVNKLKWHYEQLDSTYAHSEQFKNFLNEKRNDIMNSSDKFYIHINEVKILMKSRRKKAVQSKSNNSSESQPTVSTSNPSGSTTNDDSNAHADVINDEEDSSESAKVNRKLKIILKTMEKCEKYIKKYEEQEVDFNDESDSSYMKVERYKQRMVELYNKYCELTGDNPDAERAYLRPKHLSTTNIVAVDQAIMSFINSQITMKKNKKNIGGGVKALIFPDYSDILECIQRCNELKQLGLDKKKQQQMAKKAFIEWGEQLQRVRRLDYWDTFSLFLEKKEEDPAIKDKELAAKLNENRAVGEKKLAEVFNEYVKKQEEKKCQSEEDSTTDNDDEDDSSVEKEDEEESGDAGSARETLELPAEEEDGPSIAETAVNKDTIKSDRSEGTVAKDDKVDANKTSVQSEDNATTISEKELTDSANSTKQIEEAVEKEVTLPEGPKRVEIAKSTVVDKPVCKIAPTQLTALLGVTSNDKPEVGASAETTVLRPVEAGTEKETKRSESPVTSTAVDTKAAEEITTALSNESESNAVGGNDKPLLRVRSFAKPPNTWEDGRQKPAKQDDASKPGNAKESPVEEVVDLTNESPPQKPENPSANTPTPMAIQIRQKLLPLMIGNYKRVTLPATLTGNIIRKQNVTKPFEKPTLVPGGQAKTPPVLQSSNSGLTFVQLANVLPATRQENDKTGGPKMNGDQRNGGILHVQPSVIVSQPQTLQTFAKFQNVSAPRTKPK